MAKKESGTQWLWVALGAVLIIGFVWYYGAKPPSMYPGQQVINVPPGQNSQGQPTALPGSASASPTPMVIIGDSNSAAPEANIAGGVPACGDFNCDASERCDTCAQDCGCAGDEYCNRLNGVCYPLEQ